MFKGVFYRENLQVDTQQLSSSAELLHFHASLAQMLAVSFVDKDFWHTLGTKNGFVVHTTVYSIAFHTLALGMQGHLFSI